ncbi:MAG: ATP-binding protein [Hyphomicrobium sp.]|nr:ATP-binding protein [Hyphomicrobium sp.]
MILSDRISLKPNALEVVRLNEWLDRKFTESGLDRSLAADLKLCLNEIVANLISYSFKQTPDPLMVIDVTLRQDSAAATVSDNGPYFDLREWTSAKDRDLMTGELGGFGIALIKERASQIDYTRVDGMNRLRIVCEATNA